MRTANPALNADTFTSLRSHGSADTMTIQGTVNKTGLLLVLLVIAAGFTWHLAMSGHPAQLFVTGGAVAGLILALITCFKKTWAPVTAPMYAVAEGLLRGALSAMFEVRYPGIVLNAVTLTFGTLFALLIAYRAGIIRATENFKLGVFAATGGIALLYLVTFVLGFFNVQVPYIHDSGPIGIGFSVFVVVIAAMNLVLDFDFIEQGSEQGAPKYMEWYAAFGLMVTLIWLYIEILRLLAKLANRR